MGKILVETGFITNMQLSEALIKQKASGGSKRMGDIFIEMGVLTPHDLETALKKQQESVNRSGMRKNQGGPHPTAPVSTVPLSETGYPLSGEAAAISQFRKSPLPQPSFTSHVLPHQVASSKDSKEFLALIQLLIKKGIITMEEYFREIKGS